MTVHDLQIYRGEEIKKEFFEHESVSIHTTSFHSEWPSHLKPVVGVDHVKWTLDDHVMRRHQTMLDEMEETLQDAASCIKAPAVVTAVATSVDAATVLLLLLQ